MRCTAAVAALMTLACAGPVAAGRLLLEARGLAAGLDQPLRCGEPASVTVEAGQPEVFDAQSPELQRLMDGVRAMLAFECPDLREIQVRGVLKGLRDPVYRGIAARDADWLLQAQQAVRPSAPVGMRNKAAAGGAAETEARGTPEAEAGAESGAQRAMPEAPRAASDLTVAGLSLDMTVDQAREAVSATFGVTPEYDAQQGVMTMAAPLCPQGNQWGPERHPPQAGWKCLRAWFTDERVARLYLLELVQVVASQGVQPVERALIERYGKPAQRAPGVAPAGAGERGSGGTDGGPRGEALHLAWGDEVPAGAPLPEGAPRPAHALEAAVEPAGDVTVTTVTLCGPHVAARGATPPAPAALDLKL